MQKVMMRDVLPELSEEELKELEALDDREIVYDEESPQMTPEMLSQFHRFEQTPVCKSESDGMAKNESLQMQEEVKEYSKWRRQYFDDVSSDDFHEAAVAYARENPL